MAQNQVKFFIWVIFSICIMSGCVSSATSSDIAKLDEDKKSQIQIVNLGNSNYKDQYLNVRGDTGNVTIESYPHTGTYWNIINRGNDKYQIVNLGNSKYKGCYLNVRGDTGNVTVESYPHTGTYWNIIE